MITNFPRSIFGYNYNELMARWDKSLSTVQRWTTKMKKHRPTKRTVLVDQEDVAKFEKTSLITVTKTAAKKRA